MGRPHPWDYKNESTRAGFPTYGDIGAEVLLQRMAVERQFQRITRRAPGTAEKLVDIYFFVIALRNLEDIADFAAGRLRLGRVRKAVNAYRQAVPNATTIRHILQHWRQYLVGKGSLQRRGRLPEKLSYSVRWEAERFKATTGGRGSRRSSGDWSVNFSGAVIAVRPSYRAANDLADEVLAALQEGVTAGTAF